MNADLKQLVGKLTDAQRKQILLCEPKGRNLKTGEPCSYRAYASRTQTADVLERLGVSTREISGMGHRVVDLTPLGIALRAMLTIRGDA